MQQHISIINGIVSNIFIKQALA